MKCRRVFIGLGSNVGDRLEQLRAAATELRAIFHSHGFRASPVFETSAVGPRQRKFLNAVVQGYSDLPPAALLRRLKSIEKKLGRRKRRRWGPREIDLDILIYGTRRLRTRTLTVPHPEIARRKFVLAPLARLAPRLSHPVTRKTVAQMRRNLTDPSQSIRLFRGKI